MKRVSLLLALGFLGLSTFAQYNTMPAELAQREGTPNKNVLFPEIQKNKSIENLEENGTVIWSEDFEGELSDQWEITDDSPTSMGTWFVSDSTYPGAYISSGIGHIYGENAVEGNHFMHFPIGYYNSYVDNNGVLQPDSNSAWVDGTFKTEWINISNHPNLILKFATWFNFFAGLQHTPHFDVNFRTSANGSWLQDPLNALVFNGITLQQMTFPPEAEGDDQVAFFVKDISSLIDGADSIQFSFRVYDVNNYVTSIDDIQLIEPVANDVELVSAYATNLFTLTTYLEDNSGTKLFPYYNSHYTEVPYDIANYIHLGGYLRQNGVEATNVSLTVKMDSMGIQDVHTYNSTTNIPIFTAEADSILLCDTTNGFANAPVFYNPDLDLNFFQENGLMDDGLPYLFKYEASSDNEDANPNNNVTSLPYAQTYGRYSFHNQANVIPQDVAFYAYKMGGWSGASVGDIIFNTFEFLSDQDFKIYGMRFLVAPHSNPYWNSYDDEGNGVSVEPVILFWDNEEEEWVEIEDIDGVEPFYTIKSEDRKSYVYLQFNDEIENFDFTAHSKYRVGIKIKNYNGQVFSVAREALEDYPQGFTGGEYVASQGKFYGIGSGGAVLIDAYTKLEQFNNDKDGTVGIEPNIVANNNVKIYPNPTNGLVNIKNVEGATIEVYSITGNLIKTVKSNNVNVSINLSDLPKGTYLVKVINDTVITKKINLVK